MKNFGLLDKILRFSKQFSNLFTDSAKEFIFSSMNFIDSICIKSDGGFIA